MTVSRFAAIAAMALASASLTASFSVPAARAQGTPPAAPAATPAPAAAAQPAPADTDFVTNLWTRSTLLGDAGGFRTALGAIGVSVGLEDINEVFGNTTGGTRLGAAYDGLTMLSIGLDTKAAFGWEGGTFNVSGFNIRGQDLSAQNLLALQTVSGIEAAATTRFWEIWYQQVFADGHADVKLGQQSLDQEFLTSQGAGLFLNTAMGWPIVPTEDLYAGGPAYPLSSLGVRLRVRPTDNLTVLGGVFQDNPPGGPFYADSQLLGSTRWGGNFNLRTGALVIAEVQYAINQPVTGQDGSADQKPAGLPGTYKFGAWFDTAKFPSPQYDNTGLSLADPASTGTPAYLWHNYSLYAVADQAVWQPVATGPQVLGVFARIMGAPGDRNLVNFGLNAGATLKAPLPTRDNDTFGIGVGYAKVSGAAIAFNQAQNFYAGAFGPVRSSETFIEATYQFFPVPWWSLQPDFQYIFTPGGGIANPDNPGKSVGNEAVFGLRSVVTF